MARASSAKVTEPSGPTPFLGVQTLEILTSGMYDDPLMVYREYVQNSVDAIDEAVEKGLIAAADAVVEVNVSGKDRVVTIEDNGAGTSSEVAEDVLVDIGNSRKSLETHRGFRGIGRLGGLGYCDAVTFETRASSREPVVQVEWDAQHLRHLAGNGHDAVSVEEAVQAVCSVKRRRANGDERSHFFRVTLHNVRPFHVDAFMNLQMVRDYLSQVAPVPYDPARFSFAGLLLGHLGQVPGYREYEVVLNGTPIRKLYSDEVERGEGKCDSIADVELLEFPDPDGGELARGWYARTDFAGALPRHTKVRGLRVRQGNIQVGGESLLEQCFSETRFAKWHIGEIHVASPDMKPNARRDGFEQSDACEAFQEYAHLLGRHLSELCRVASGARRDGRRARERLQRLRRLIGSPRVFTSDDQMSTTLRAAESAATALAADGQLEQLPDEEAAEAQRLLCDLEELRKQPNVMPQCLDGRRLKEKEAKELLRELCEGILKHYPQAGSAAELVSLLAQPYLTPSARNR